MSVGFKKLCGNAESLADRQRLLPAIQTLEKARRLTQIHDHRAWASYNLGTIHWHFLGNGVTARCEFLAAIEIFDKHGYEPHSRHQLIHANALENSMLCALSFEEFQNLAARLDTVAPGVPILTGLVPEVIENHERGFSWSDQLFNIAASFYNRNDTRQDVGRYGAAKSTYHLLLAHRIDLRLSREDWRMAVFEYCALSMRMASDCFKVRGGDNDPDSPEEFLPILTEAFPLVDEYLIANSGDDGLKKIREDMELMVTLCRKRWDIKNQGMPVSSGASYQYPHSQSWAEKLAMMIKGIIFILFIPPLVVSLAYSPPSFFCSFLASSIIPFFTGKSRRVIDPVAGIFKWTTLSPNEFHEWAKFVCTDNQYEQLYLQYLLDAKKGVSKNISFMFSQIKAITYVYSWKILLMLLFPLNMFCIYDLFKLNISFHSPILMGAIEGLIWGYSLGVYVLWQTCRRYKSQGDLPL